MKVIKGNVEQKNGPPEAPNMSEGDSNLESQSKFFGEEYMNEGELLPSEPDDMELSDVDEGRSMVPMNQTKSDIGQQWTGSNKKRSQKDPPQDLRKMSSS